MIIYMKMDGHTTLLILGVRPRILCLLLGFIEDPELIKFPEYLLPNDEREQERLGKSYAQRVADAFFNQCFIGRSSALYL